MEEKRRAKRVKDEGEVTVTLMSQNEVIKGCRVFHHTSKDISLVGIRIQCNTFIPLNSMLKIELSLGTTAKAVTAYGRVRWIKSLYGDELFELGIEFVDTSQEIIRMLRNHIEKISGGGIS